MPAPPTPARLAGAAALPGGRDALGFAENWGPTAVDSPWLRLRSGFVLTLLLTVVGALLAIGVAGVVVLIALAVRSAVS